MSLINVIILTYQEELNLPICLASIQGLDADIHVVDSGSTDSTTKIAEEAGAYVTTHRFETHARQLNWALDNLPLGAPWTIWLAADERLTQELAKELPTVLANASDNVSGFLINRRVYFWNRWIRHGGYYPAWFLRVWRTGKGRAEDRQVDEHVYVLDGETRQLDGDIIDENHKGLSFWIDKHNSYADREVENILGNRSDLEAQKSGPQAALKRYLKDRIYGHAPKFLRAFLYWVLRYIILLGFLDGKAGFVFHFMQGFWYRLLVDAKLHEYEMKMQMKSTSRHQSTAKDALI